MSRELLGSLLGWMGSVMVMGVYIYLLARYRWGPAESHRKTLYMYLLGAGISSLFVLGFGLSIVLSLIGTREKTLVLAILLLGSMLAFFFAAGTFVVRILKPDYGRGGGDTPQ